MTKFTINGSELELKKLTVGEWLEIAKIYDEMEKSDLTNVAYIKCRCKVIKIAFDLTEEEIGKLPIEEVIPLYLNITKAIGELVVSKLNEKKSETESTLVKN